jgi:hypothetical protein
VLEHAKKEWDVLFWRGRVRYRNSFYCFDQFTGLVESATGLLKFEICIDTRALKEKGRLYEYSRQADAG